MIQLLNQKILEMSFYDVYTILKYKQTQDVQFNYSYNIEILSDNKVKIISVIRLTDLELKSKLENKEITTIDIAKIVNMSILKVPADYICMDDQNKHSLTSEARKIILSNNIINVKTLMKVVLMLFSFNFNDIIINVNEIN